MLLKLHVPIVPLRRPPFGSDPLGQAAEVRSISNIRSYLQAGIGFWLIAALLTACSQGRNENTNGKTTNRQVTASPTRLTFARVPDTPLPVFSMPTANPYVDNPLLNPVYQNGVANALSHDLTVTNEQLGRSLFSGVPSVNSQGVTLKIDADVWVTLSSQDQRLTERTIGGYIVKYFDSQKIDLSNDVNGVEIELDDLSGTAVFRDTFHPYAR